MARFGLFILSLGVVSFILNMMSLNFKILMWIDLWGTKIGMIIRAVMVVLGGALIFFGLREDDDELGGKT